MTCGCSSTAGPIIPPGIAARKATTPDSQPTVWAVTVGHPTNASALAMARAVPTMASSAPTRAVP
jgi:hypothetical protein